MRQIMFINPYKGLSFEDPQKTKFKFKINNMN